jgi:hypothetical protein
MVGWRGLPYKDRRAVRRKNHIALDLPRKVDKNKSKKKRIEEDDDQLDDE